MPPKDRMNLTKKKVFTRISAIPYHSYFSSLDGMGVSTCRAFYYKNSVYVLNWITWGGSTSNIPKKQQIKFNNNNWTNIKNYNLDGDYLECGNINGYAYMVCSDGRYNYRTPRVYKFKDDETWEKVSEYTTSDRQLKTIAVIDDDAIYAIVSDKSNSNSLIKYDTKNWTIVSKNIPLNYTNVRIVKFKNELHFIGSSEHYKFNGSTWTKLATPPIFYEFNAVANDEKIYVIGARKSTSYKDFRNTYEYNGSTWALIPNFMLKNASFETGVLVKDGNIWLIGAGLEGTCARQETIYTEIKE